MKLVKLSAVAIAALALGTVAQAEDAKPKRELKNNMMVVTNVTPKAANSITEAFTNGVFYGRLRTNIFKWDFKDDANGDNHAFGLGGSLSYHTGSYKGFSAYANMSYSDSPFSGLRMTPGDIGKVKSGKDTFSRYDVANAGNYSMASLAEANLQYQFSKTKIIAGRQIFESFLTKSNDTKMIPNTFEGIVVETKELADTRIRGAYFYAQKLRDHTTFHDATITGVRGSADKSHWNGNDDSGAHWGLNVDNMRAAGKSTESALVVIDAQNKSIENLQVDVTYGAVPGLLSSITGELNYQVNLGDGYSLTPGVRVMHQMDNGAGEIGGAGLSGRLAGQSGAALGYKNADSLDSTLSMARLVLKKGALKAQVGYSSVSDDADIVAPWRGFVTGGYTRAMAQVNWRANTKTTAVQVDYDFGKAGILPGFSAMAHYAMQDRDEAKQAAGNQADANILHIDLRQKLSPDVWTRFRVGLVDSEALVVGSNAGKDRDTYNEYRFEVNYLF